jgi:uncharacterized protein (TIGR02466 family)
VLEPSINLLFPKTIITNELNREFTIEELDAINKHKSNIIKNEGNSISQDNYILNDPAFFNLKQKCLEQLNEYIKVVYKPKNSITPYITQSWITYSNKGDFHHKHKHPNSFISGVLYINADEIKDKLIFHDESYYQIQIEPSEYDSLNSIQWYIPAKTKRFIIFPSCMIHSVDKVDSEDTRICLGFNSFVYGVLGDVNRVSELILK